MRLFALPLAIVALSGAAGAQAPHNLAWDSVGTMLGAAPTFTGGYVRYNLPRRDLTVMVAGVRASTVLSGDGWVGFYGATGDATLMGDLVVVAKELAGFERELIAGGLQFTSVHSRLLSESPHVMYVHVIGHGSATTMARVLDRALKQTATPRPVAAAAAAALTADTAMVFSALGERGWGAGNVASVSVELVGAPVAANGGVLPAALVSSSQINVQFISRTRIILSGDIAATERQLEPVIRALVHGGLTVTAVHSQLLGESPRVISTHFWGDGAPATVLAVVRRAFDAARTAAP
jgi:hypothetical protein